MRSAARVVLAALALAGCSKKTEPAPASGATPAAPRVPATFSLRDLATATALDARLARFSLAASDLDAALPGPGAAPARAPAGAAPGARGGAGALLAEVQGTCAEVERAADAVSNPADRDPARRGAAAARAYAGKLAASVAGDAAALAPERLAARDALGAAISEYRASRRRWRLEAPEPQGSEREFAEARREAERAESAAGGRTRVAPRDEGHELEPAAAGMAGALAARRAGAAAERLPEPLRAPALRWAAAEERALEAVSALAGAPEAERPAIARRYHAAKADALGALADYFAALAAR